jgi:hypothetical protein
MKVYNRGVKLAGEVQNIGGNVIKVLEYDVNGDVLLASGTTVPTATSKGFAKGCVFIDTDVATGTSGRYDNIGTNLSCSFVNAATSAMIADAAVTYAKLSVGSQAVTGTDDGLTTGLITAPTSFKTFVAVTSAGATKAVTLPSATAANIGVEIYLTVAANGYELLTPASSNQTINMADSDGTGQVDVAANSVLRCTQVSATGWLAEQIITNGISVVAPDND